MEKKSQKFLQNILWIFLIIIYFKILIYKFDFLKIN